MKTIKLSWWALGLLVLSCKERMDVGAQASGPEGFLPAIGGAPAAALATGGAGTGGASTGGTSTGGTSTGGTSAGGTSAGGRSIVGDSGGGGSETGGGAGASSAGGAGGDAMLSVLGKLGEGCIRGGLAVEAKGQVSQAEVRTLDRCDDGLVCSSTKLCIPAPLCAGSSGGECLLYAGREGGSGAQLGGGGTGSAPLGGVVGLAADESNLYWIDYGTRDQLGNYQGDGALMAHSFQSGINTTISAQLAGPVALGITTSHAFVAVDGAPLPGGSPHRQLLRVPLQGGIAELVQDNLSEHLLMGFVNSGSQAFWSDYTNIYTSSGTATQTSLFATGGSDTIIADGQNAYFTRNVAPYMLWRLPVAGGTPVPVAPSSHNIGIRGDFIYRIERLEEGPVLGRVASSGGNWERIRGLGGGLPIFKFQIVGDRYVLDQYTPGGFTKRAILTASFVSDAPPVRLIERAEYQSLVNHLWVATSQALYWSDGKSIYTHPLNPNP